MPSTHTSLHYHIIFSTKGRAPIISVRWREKLHAYLGGIVRNIEAIPEAIGGTADHVYLIIGTSPTKALADVVRDIKASSSRWVHEEPGDRLFAWQEGYAAFTVSSSQRRKVRENIASQDEHHRRRTFQEEYVDLLKRCGLDFDERYLW